VLFSEGHPGAGRSGARCIGSRIVMA